MAKIKLKPKARKGVIKIKALITHPMETGLRKKKGKLVPANYITDLSVSVNGTKIVTGDIGSTISKNPYFQFQVSGKKGDKVSISYNDNNGKSGSKTAKSK
jgi:sulfur-oxidizing protein SoxZ